MISDWPHYFRDNLTFGDRDHPVAVCSLWMKQARLAQVLSPDSYSVLGNLYSKDGINYLLRNILARPTIRAIVLCGPDLTQSGAALCKVMNDGVDGAHRIIGDGAPIETEISLDAIETFRAKVRLVDLRGMHDPEKICAALNDVSAGLARGAFAEPRVFPRSTPAADEFPSEETGFVVHGECIVPAWVNLLAAVLAFGKRDLTAYTVQQRELLDVVATVSDEDPAEIYLPDWVPLTREQLTAYYPQLLTSARPENIAYTYGEHAYHLAISGTKSMLGHMVGAAGAVSALAAVLAIRDGVVPPTINLDHPDPACDLDYVPKVARQMPVRAAMINAFGFGGQNVALVLRRYPE